MQNEVTTPTEPPKIADNQVPSRSRLFLPLMLGLALIVVVGLLLNLFSSKKPATQTVAPSRTVSIQINDQGFTPATLTVTAGTIVTWTNDGTNLHIVAANPYPKDNGTPGLKSPELGKGASFHFTFSKAGTYTYHDDLHPALNATVIVK